MTTETDQYENVGVMQCDVTQFTTPMEMCARKHADRRAFSNTYARALVIHPKRILRPGDIFVEMINNHYVYQREMIIPKNSIGVVYRSMHNPEVCLVKVTHMNLGELVPCIEVTDDTEIQTVFSVTMIRVNLEKHMNGFCDSTWKSLFDNENKIIEGFVTKSFDNKVNACVVYLELKEYGCEPFKNWI